jgi:uncharacterized protein YbjT (DUF2867 family)
MKIVVIGGTGLIGSKTVEKLKQRGHEVVAAAPNTGVNTITGEGLAKALTGATVVIDVSNSPSFDEADATAFFQTAGKNVTAAEVAAGVKHHIALSVVGTDRLQDSGYFRAKAAQEKAIQASPIPYSVIHATQFYEFIRTIAGFSMVDGAVRLPPVKFQPIAADDIATILADVAEAQPINSILEIAGPDMTTLDESVRQTLAFDKDPREVITDPKAPYFGVNVSDETLVPGPGARLGATGFAWWLANVPPPPPRK